MPSETCAELDALDRRIAEEWMGWEWREPYEPQIGGDNPPWPWYGTWETPDGQYRPTPRFTRDPNAAGEARRMADKARVEQFPDAIFVAVGRWGEEGHAIEYLRDHDDDKGFTEALATRRAIEAALNVRKESDAT